MTASPGPERLPTPPPRPTGRVLAAAALVLGLGGAAYWAWPRPDPPPPDPPPARPTEPDLAEPSAPPNPGYVGPAACAECHKARVAEFEKTRHYRACWNPARGGPMPPAFTPAHALASPREPGVRYEFDRGGTAYLQTVVRPGAERHPLAIDLVYGTAGGADEVYFAWKGDRLVELPAMWLHPTAEWGEQRFNHGPDLTRPVTTRCLECHNTWLGHVPGTENRYDRTGAVFGVTCESCHGPARDHVAHHRATPGAPGGALVHPGKLSRDRLTDVCAQCHSNAIRARGPMFAYRPGEPLDDHFRTLTAEGRENDHVADQTRYLRRSKCYQKSDALTCVTCHDPHKPADAARTAAACAECHTPAHCREQPKLPAGAGGDCVGCHMPRYPRVAVNFHTAADKFVFPVRPHDHRIAVYPAARLEVLAAFHAKQPGGKAKADEYAAELAAVRLKEAEAFAREFRYLEAIGAARDAVTAKDTPAARDRLRQLIETQQGLDVGFHTADRQAAARDVPGAIRTLEGVLQVKPTWAPARGKLGTLYAMAGDRAKAVEHLTAVARADPDDPYGYNMLGWLAYLDGKAADAADLFRRADELHPNTAEINYRWGLALLQLEKWPDAAARFRRATAVDPKHAGAFQGLGHALRRTGPADEAVRAARRAAQLTEYKNADVLLTLADAYAAADRPAEAVEAAGKAVDAALVSNPGLVDQARRRLDELRARRN